MPRRGNRTVARDFESLVGQKKWVTSRRDDGNTETTAANRLAPCSQRPYGTEFLLMPHPALKCRATIRLPLRGKERRPKRCG